MRNKVSLTLALLLLMSIPAMAGWDEGVAAFRSKDYQSAYTLFQEYVQSNPSVAQGHYMLGTVAMQIKRNDEALTHLRKAYDLNPNDLATKMALARSYSTAKRYSDVAKLLGSIDASGLPASQKAFFYQARGTSRAKTNDSSGALADFAQLAKLKPDSAAIQYSYGSQALAAGKTSEGMRAVEKAISLDPKNESYRRSLAKTLIASGRRSRDANAKKSAYQKAVEAGERSHTDQRHLRQLDAQGVGGARCRPL